jgi:hypothetical protein
MGSDKVYTYRVMALRGGIPGQAKSAELTIQWRSLPANTTIPGTVSGDGVNYYYFRATTNGNYDVMATGQLVSLSVLVNGAKLDQ